MQGFGEIVPSPCFFAVFVCQDAKKNERASEATL